MQVVSEFISSYLSRRMEKKEETNTKQSPEHRSESPPPRCPRSLAHLNTVHMRDQTPRAHIRAFNEDGSLNDEYVPSRNLGERIFPAGVSNDVSGGTAQEVGPSKKADGQRGGVGDKGNKDQVLTECYDNGDNDFDILCEDRLSAVSVVENFVKSIFHCKEICYKIDGNENITEAVLEIINDTHSGSSEVELGYLGVNVRRGRNGTYRVPNLPPIENDALKLVLDTLRDDIDLKINCCPGEGFQYDKPIRQKNVFMGTANWFTLKNFMDSKCEYFHVNTMFRPPSRFSLKNVNTYLKRWNTGAQPHIRKFIIKCEWNKIQINQTLFDGIDVFDIVETTQQDNNGAVAYQFECKIQGVNGTTASVSIKKQIFRFQVL
ncbi:hypothetical protein GCK72_022790 [Caenorhabditis remanei]|uniref:Sdz-33 F-box domain-containing protein n=1 Tax=Caenorhabditis remanei TaxID=31234 RepID=A0A6A5FUS0_CAERE|nr:hypothetical protein GCK72_022790 [Caenorhabditis remanei]KAF1746337.1 hypothetical protein GCK72_022790 [Caenorhabditis remanei]